MRTSTCRALRSSTRDLHDTVEADTLVRPLLGPTLRADQYVAFLIGCARAFARLDPSLVTTDPAVPPYRPRLPIIRADLGQLGVRLDAGAGIDTHTGPVRADAAYWGRRYVVEGMTLGAALIRRQLRPSGEWAATHEHRFLSLRGTPWPQLCDLLEIHVNDESGRTAATAAARATFELLHAHLDPTGDRRA